MPGPTPLLAFLCNEDSVVSSPRFSVFSSHCVSTIEQPPDVPVRRFVPFGLRHRPVLPGNQTPYTQWMLIDSLQGREISA
jgi:hypothetical protein